MTVRIRFKVDSIHKNHSHLGYELGKDKRPDLSRPINENTATLSLSAVDPVAGDENSALWKNRAQGRVMLTAIAEDLVAGLKGGMEVLIDMTPVALPEPESVAKEVAAGDGVAPAPAIHEPVKAIHS